MSWRCSDLTFSYPEAAHPAVKGVSLEVPGGSFTAVLGPNGSGKSTLLRLLLGVARPGAGTVEFEGRPVSEWPRGRIARRIGVVSQQEEMPFPLTVRELVAMGRYPHLGPWRREGVADRRAVDEAMARCDVAGLSARPVSTLSGGERQRARLARALAQQPRALALDEPTIALDVRHEMGIFELLRGLVTEGVTVLVVTHNLNLAARYADRIVLLDSGRVAAGGPPRDVVRRELLEAVYGWPLQIVSHAGPGADTGAPQVIPVRAERAESRPRATSDHPD